MRPSSIQRPSAQGGEQVRDGGAREPCELCESGSNRGGKEQGRELHGGNISGNKGMGTFVSMVIPSSGFGRRAGKRPSRAPRSLPARRTAPGRVASRAASRRNASGRAEGQETSSRALSSSLSLFLPIFADRETDVRRGGTRGALLPG